MRSRHARLDIKWPEHEPNSSLCNSYVCLLSSTLEFRSRHIAWSALARVSIRRLPRILDTERDLPVAPVSGSSAWRALKQVSTSGLRACANLRQLRFCRIKFCRGYQIDTSVLQSPYPASMRDLPARVLVRDLSRSDSRFDCRIVIRARFANDFLQALVTRAVCRLPQQFVSIRWLADFTQAHILRSSLMKRHPRSRSLSMTRSEPQLRSISRNDESRDLSQILFYGCFAICCRILAHLRLNSVSLT